LKRDDKDGTITDVINANQSILVQVVKNQYLKGPRISAELSRRKIYCFSSFSDRVSISQNRDKKKRRLKKLVQSNQKDLVLLFAQ
jgi:ribonuclease G